MPFTVAAGIVVVAAFLLAGGRAAAGTDCRYGEITLVSRPSLSAPSPTYPGDTVTSTGGGWSTCGDEAFTGFYEEWLRDGAVIDGPEWVEGAPDSFTYTVQEADIGHELRSAVSACDDDYGCYLPYAQSSSSVVPVSPPPPPGPPIAVQGYVHDSKGSPVPGATVALYQDLDTGGAAAQAEPLDGRRRTATATTRSARTRTGSRMRMASPTLRSRALPATSRTTRWRRGNGTGTGAG